MLIFFRDSAISVVLEEKEVFDLSQLGIFLFLARVELSILFFSFVQKKTVRCSLLASLNFLGVLRWFAGMTLAGVPTKSALCFKHFKAKRTLYICCFIWRLVGAAFVWGGTSAVTQKLLRVQDLRGFDAKLMHDWRWLLRCSEIWGLWIGFQWLWVPQLSEVPWAQVLYHDVRHLCNGKKGHHVFWV